MITSLLLTSFNTKTKQSTTYEQYRFVVLIGDSLSITMWHNDKINYHLTSSIGKVTHIIILTTRVTFLLQSCEKSMYTGCMWPCLYMFINNIYKCKLITCTHVYVTYTTLSDNILIKEINLYSHGWHTLNIDTLISWCRHDLYKKKSG